MSTVPDNYERQADFTNFAPENSGQPTVGSDLEAEFNESRRVANALLSRLAEIQRDDGMLGNNTVHTESLSAQVRAIIGLSSVARIRGAWVTATAYAVGDVITQGGSTYICCTAHTSGTFATDLAAVKWITINAAGLTASAFIQTLLDDADAATARNTLGANDAANLNTGTLPAARLPAMTGDVTASAGSHATTIAAGALGATGAGLAKMADGFFQLSSAALAKFVDGFWTASAEGRAKFADRIWTFPKLPAISTSRLLGRTTASSGDIEELAIGNGLAFGAGSLDTNRASTSDARAMTDTTKAMTPSTHKDAHLLSRTTVSSPVSSVDVSLVSFLSAYRHFMVVFDGVRPSTDDSVFWLRVSEDGGSSFKSGASDYSEATRRQNSGASGTDEFQGNAAQVRLSGQGQADSGDAGNSVNGKITIYNPSTSTYRKHIGIDQVLVQTNTNSQVTMGMGIYKNTPAINALRFLFDAGNISSGTFSLYGLP